MRIDRLLPMLPLLAITACNAGSSSRGASTDGAVLDANESASSAALGASGAAMGPLFGGAPGDGGPGGHPGCMPAVTVLATTAVCTHDVPTQVQLDWNCSGPDGGTFTGTDIVTTTVTPDACPPAQLAIAQSISLNDQRAHDTKSVQITGTSSASWNQPAPPPPTGAMTPPPPPPPADRTISVDVHVVAADAGTTVHDAQITGSRTVAFDDGGTVGTPGDDSMTENGSVSIADAATDEKIDRSDVNLVRKRDCCWPIGGTASLSKGDLDDTSAPLVTHVFAFGPSCGDATEDGADVSLPSCPAPPPPSAN